MEMFYLLLFHSTASISGPLINFSGFSDLDSLVNDLRIPFSCLETREWWKQQIFPCLFQLIKYNWPGNKDMGIDGAVPSYQLLLACRDKDAELSLCICQGLSQYLHPTSLSH